jgi:hypothetical protein
MFRGSRAGLGVKYYFKATRKVALLLGTYFSIAFPDHYLKYKEAFEAGFWYSEDPGPWLGRALVYKLQVRAHRDSLDGGPTAIFNVGQYIGGKLYYPSLSLKFLSVKTLLLSFAMLTLLLPRYKPGDIHIFLAGSIYHAVAPWKPASGVGLDGITPGRIGHVFFSPKASLERLEGKRKEWRNDTFSGLWPSTSLRPCHRPKKKTSPQQEKQ